MQNIISFPGAEERHRRYVEKASAKATWALEHLKWGTRKNESGRYVIWWIGTKQELVKGAICEPSMFPCKRNWAYERRRASDSSWAMDKLDDGTWRVVFYLYNRKEERK